MQRLGHQVADLVATHLASIRSQPVIASSPRAALNEALLKPAPRRPSSFDSILDDARCARISVSCARAASGIHGVRAKLSDFSRAPRRLDRDWLQLLCRGVAGCRRAQSDRDGRARMDPRMARSGEFCERSARVRRLRCESHGARRSASRCSLEGRRHFASHRLHDGTGAFIGREIRLDCGSAARERAARRDGRPIQASYRQPVQCNRRRPRIGDVALHGRRECRHDEHRRRGPDRRHCRRLPARVGVASRRCRVRRLRRADRPRESECSDDWISPTASLSILTSGCSFRSSADA